MGISSRPGSALRPGAAALSALLLASPAAALVERTIQIDGAVEDWGVVLLSPPNQVIDASTSQGDPDAPAEPRRDLRRLAVTWDDTHLFVYFRRVDRLAENQKRDTVYLAYIDRDDDGDLDAADAILALRSNNTDLSDSDLYTYVPADTADAMPGDGAAPAGRGGAPLLADVSGRQQEDKRELEASVRWSDLGVPPGAPLRIQAAIFYTPWIGDTDAAVAALPAGVDDNSDVLTTGHVAVTITEGAAYGSGEQQVVHVPHRICAGGNWSQTIDLVASVDDTWVLELWTDPDGDGNPADGDRLALDQNGNGSYIDAGDSLGPGADGNVNLRPDFGLQAPNDCRDLVIAVAVPAGVGDRERTLLVQARSDRDANAQASAVDFLRAGDVVVVPRRNQSGAPGETVGLEHDVCLYSSSGAGNRIAHLTASSPAGWSVSVWSGGLPVSQLSLTRGECEPVELRVAIPIAALPGAVDQPSLLASVSAGGPADSDSVIDTLTVSTGLSLTPDRTGYGIAGEPAFYAHTLNNGTSAARVLDLSVISTASSELWSDPDLDGLPIDGEPTTVVAAASSEALGLVVQVDLADTLVPGQVVDATIEARDSLDPGATASATDTTTVRLLATFVAEPPAFASDLFYSCDEVFATAGPLNKDPHRLLWYDADGNLVRVSSSLIADGDDRVTDSLTLLVGDPPGNWQVQLERFAGAWTPVDPGGLHQFRVERDLTAGSGSITTLHTDLPSYPPAGSLVSLTTTIANRSGLTFAASSVELLVFHDDDGSGAADIGEPFLRLDGATQPYSGSAFTCRATGLADLGPGESRIVSECRDIGPADFGGEDGAWFLRARWKNECGGEIAERTVGFNVGCVGGATDAGLDRAICAGETTTLGSGSGLPGQSFVWSPVDGLDDPAAAEPVAAPVVTTTYTSNLLDATGCVARDEVTVQVLSPPAELAGSSQTICAGDSIGLGVTPLPGMSYSWLPTVGLDDPSAAQPIASPSISTSYTLTATDGNGCSTTSVAVVTVGQMPTADAGPDRPTGGTLGPAVCDSSLVHQWVPATDLDDPTACNPVATPSGTTQYCLSEIDPVTGCASAPDCATVGSGSCPDIPDAGADGDGPRVIGPATCDPTLDYQWTPSAGLDDPTACNPMADPALPTTYCVTARDPSSGCVSLADCVDVGDVAACPATPGAASDLRLVRIGADVRLTWLAASGAGGGHRIYHVAIKAELATFPATAARLADVVDPLALETLTPGAPSGYYRVVGVCVDGTTEGP